MQSILEIFTARNCSFSLPSLRNELIRIPWGDVASCGLGNSDPRARVLVGENLLLSEGVRNETGRRFWLLGRKTLEFGNAVFKLALPSRRSAVWFSQFQLGLPNSWFLTHSSPKPCEYQSNYERSVVTWTRAANKHPDAKPAIAGASLILRGLEICFEHRLETNRNVLCLYLSSNKLQSSYIIPTFISNIFAEGSQSDV